MTSARKPGQRFLKTIERLIGGSERSQREIADALGYERANIISMFKTGVTRVPLDKVPALAHAVDADPAYLVNLWLEDYAPELKRVVDENAGMPLSRTERSWIANLRRMFPGGLPPWDETVEDALKPLAAAHAR